MSGILARRQRAVERRDQPAAQGDQRPAAAGILRTALDSGDYVPVYLPD